MEGLIRKCLVLAAAAMLAGLAACGGGDSHKSVPPPPEKTTGIVGVGIVTGFGSVFVDGVEYDTSAAEVTMRDVSATLADLKVGHYVEVKGHSHGAGYHADVIRYHNVLEGPIASIDVGAGSFVAMGQTVLVTSATSFGDEVVPASIEGLKAGDVVEVSGMVPLEGPIEAKRIDVKPDGGPYDVTGYVAGVVAASHRFNLSALVVDYSGADMSDFTDGVPAAGDLVLVKGFTFAPDGSLLASSVELRSDDWLTAAAGDVLKVDGIITDFVSATDFHVASRPVTTTPTTTYERGTVADLADGVPVMVEGMANATGVLVAAKIRFQAVSDLRIVAQVGELNAAGRSMKLLGLSVATDATTRYEDMSALDLRDFGFEDLRVDDWVDVRGYEDPEGSNAVLATRVERIDPASSVQLRGPYRDPARPNFRILSGLVLTTDATRFVLEGGTRLTADQFFTQAPGSLVEAWGTWNGVALAAARVELKVTED